FPRGGRSDRPAGNASEPLAELIPERDVDAAAQPGQRIELLTRGHPIRETQVAREVPDAPPRLDPVATRVEPKHERLSCRRPDQVEQQPDRRAFAGAVRARGPEYLARL